MGAIFNQVYSKENQFKYVKEVRPGDGHDCFAYELKGLE